MEAAFIAAGAALAGVLLSTISAIVLNRLQYRDSENDREFHKLEARYIDRRRAYVSLIDAGSRAIRGSRATDLEKMAVNLAFAEVLLLASETVSDAAESYIREIDSMVYDFNPRSNSYDIGLDEFIRAAKSDLGILDGNEVVRAAPFPHKSFGEAH